MEDKTEKKSKKSYINYKTVQCPVCGARILHMNKRRHERTQKHKDALYLWHEQFEIK